MTPSIQATFNLDDKTVTIEDIFDYSALTYTSVFGNVTARMGNTIFHQNTNFDSSADIVIGTNTSVTFDLPVDTNGNIIPASYSFSYAVKINGEVLIALATVTPPSGSPFTSIVLNPASQPSIDAVQDNLDAGGVQVISFKDSGDVEITTGVPNSTSGSATIGFPAVTTASFASIAKVTVTATTTYTKVFTYAWEGCDEVTLNLCVSSNCYTSQLTAIDATSYPSGVTLSRAIVIQYPRLANGSSVLPSVTTTDASKTIGPNIYTGNYTVSLSSALTWTQDDGLIVNTTSTSYKEENVQCTNGLCGLSECINAYRTAYMNALAVGARDIQQLQLQNQVILLYCNQIRIAIDCNETEQATELITALSAYMNTTNPSLGGCSCGCGSSSGSYTEPTIIYPLFGPNYDLTLQNITENGNTTSLGITALSFTDANGPVKPYKVYVALLLQASNTAPLATELQDDIGITAPNYSYVSTGVYKITKTGAFTENKTTVMVASFTAGWNRVFANRISDDEIEINTSENSGIAANDILNNSVIEIRVYP